MFSDHNTTKNARQRSLLLCIETSFALHVRYTGECARYDCVLRSAVANATSICIYMHMKKLNLYARLTFMGYLWPKKAYVAGLLLISVDKQWLKECSLHKKSCNLTRSCAFARNSAPVCALFICIQFFFRTDSLK